MSQDANGVFVDNLGYEVTKLGLQANRECGQTVKEKTDRELYDRDAASISLGSAITIEAGDEIQLEVIQTPAIDNAPAVTWETSDAEKAVVTAEGIVRAKKAGSVNIIATSAEDETVTATVAVTVVEAGSPRITVLSADESMGTVAGGGLFAVGATAAISATAKTGFEFDKWNDNDTNASRNITVSESATFTAAFKVMKVTVTATAGENGSVAGDGEVDYGTEVTLVATPAADHTFTKWVKTADETVTVSEEASYSFVATEDIAVKAIFA